MLLPNMFVADGSVFKLPSGSKRSFASASAYAFTAFSLISARLSRMESLRVTRQLVN